VSPESLDSAGRAFCVELSTLVKTFRRPDGGSFVKAHGATGVGRILVVTNWFAELCDRDGGC
jgi:hypothetical protein